MPRRIAIVKLGSSSVTRDEGPDPVLFASTMLSISRAQAAGWAVVLVSSGAAALGSVLLKDANPPTATPDETGRKDEGKGRKGDKPSRHLRSAVGQPELMSLYRFLGDTCRMETCQVLLSANDLQDPERMQRVAKLIHEALDAGRLPILNGNDSTDATVYDNDSLAASIAIACRADHVLLLSDVPGVLSGVGTVFGELRPQDTNKVTSIGSSGTGTGGIKSKVRSASLAALNGVRVTIAQATEPHVIERILAGEELGTTFPAQVPLKETPRSLWIGGIASTSGRVVVNLEAEESITHGASLFGSGVKRVTGTFGPGATVDIADQGKRLIGRGAIRVSSDLLSLARAMQPTETVELYVWLLANLAGDGVDAVGDGTRSPRASRAIESAAAYAPERLANLGREVLQMFPTVASAALVRARADALEEELLAATQRFSLIDNRNLVIFPTH
jgi:glutamate 5-kinase